MKRIRPFSYLRMKTKWAEGVAGFAIGGTSGGGVDGHGGWLRLWRDKVHRMRGRNS